MVSVARSLQPDNARRLGLVTQLYEVFFIYREKRRDTFNKETPWSWSITMQRIPWNVGRKIDQKHVTTLKKGKGPPEISEESGVRFTHTFYILVILQYQLIRKQFKNILFLAQ